MKGHAQDVERCWCGRYQLKERTVRCGPCGFQLQYRTVLSGQRDMCSQECSDEFARCYARRGYVPGFLHLNNREPPGNRIMANGKPFGQLNCCVCQKERGADWVSRGNDTYCLVCWDVFCKNGLF